MSADDRALIDTNVLLYAADQDSPQHEASIALYRAATSGQIAACVTAQVLLEYVAVVTNPRRVANAIAAEEAWRDAEVFLDVFSLIEPRPDHVERLVALAKSLGVKGPEVFDLAIAVTMLGAGVSTVYTYDSRLFGRVRGITVREP
jgi:toxin-antitoxin system PIN domain toxin